MPELTKDNQVKKLPQWAQRYISALEERVKRLENQMDQMTGNENTSVSYNVMLDPPHPLPSNANVRFVMGEYDDDHIECKLQKRGEQVILVVGSG